MAIHIVYPEDRMVSEATILTWHADAITNGKLPASTHTKDVLRAALDLEDIGQITVAGWQKVDCVPKDSPSCLCTEPPMMASLEVQKAAMEILLARSNPNPKIRFMDDFSYCPNPAVEEALMALIGATPSSQISEEARLAVVLWLEGEKNG